MIAVFLADGFEEIEALATVDILRRAALPVSTVGIGTAVPVGAHGMPIQTDLTEETLNISVLTAVVLPGGMPGTLHLEKSLTVQSAIAYAVDKRLPIGAICAAPSILGRGGYLEEVEATCYPGFEDHLTGSILSEKKVITDDLFTTAAGAGVAIEFALELVARLVSPEKANEIREAMQCL